MNNYTHTCKILIRNLSAQTSVSIIRRSDAYVYKADWAKAGDRPGKDGYNYNDKTGSGAGLIQIE